MIKNECLTSNISQNSLKVDSELTKKARDISLNFNRRMSEIQKKVDDLENYSKHVTLRVASTASKMANLKNQKAVKQVISQRNVPVPKDSEPRLNFSSSSFSADFLEAYKNAIMESGNSINSLENPAVFTAGHIQVQMETNGFTNGHETNGHGSREVNHENGFHVPQSQSDRKETDVEDNFEEEIRESPIVPVVEDIQDTRGSLPIVQETSAPPPALPTTSEEPQQVIEEYSEKTKDDPKQTQNGISTNPPENKSPSVEKTDPIRSAALASVIGEMKEKVAAKGAAARLFGSDSDEDSDEDQNNKPSVSRPMPPQEVKKTVEPAAQKIPVAGPRSSLPVQDVVKPLVKVEQPAPKSAIPVQKSNGPTPMTKESARAAAKAIASSLFDSDSDSDSDFMKSPQNPAANQKPAPAKVEPVLPSPTTKTQPKRPTPPKASEPTVIKKSIFGSDSDSDDDFMRSFSKTVPKQTKPVATTTTKAEKVINTPAQVAKPAPVTAPTSSAPVTQKIEIKKPTKSLFDDSDSDSDLFTSSSTKLKLPASTSKPEMEPTSSAPTPMKKAEGPTVSEKMSAKISLIEGMQKSFHLPGSPNIPVKSSPVNSENEAENDKIEQDDEVGAILKNRTRGPANRRPPTRVPK